MAAWGPANPSKSIAHDSDVASLVVPPRASIAAGFAAMGARRLLVFGGIALIAAGMLFGDVFAVFVLHQDGGATGAALLSAAQAAAAQNVAGVQEAFGRIGSLQEDHGTKVDTHVHVIGAGYLALLLALLQPYIALSMPVKKFLAKLVLAGGVLLPIGIFLIHYVGLAYSPFAAIGWASVLADSAGALLIIALVGEAWGLWKYFRRRVGEMEPEFPQNRSWERRMLLSGGTVLILLGFLHGAWYAGTRLYGYEADETKILNSMLESSARNDSTAIQRAGNDYGQLQVATAVNIAAHSHAIEFGLLAVLLSFVQPYVLLSDRWKRIWVQTLLAGSLILPVCVWLEQYFGLVPGGIADLGGLMVVVALAGMLVGILRYSGSLDAAGAS